MSRSHWSKDGQLSRAKGTRTYISDLCLSVEIRRSRESSPFAFRSRSDGCQSLFIALFIKIDLLLQLLFRQALRPFVVIRVHNIRSDPRH